MLKTMTARPTFTYVFLGLVILLLAIRAVLPYVLLHYVENQINKIPEYRVKIEDLDLSLLRGSYTIKKLQLWKMDKKIPVPFFSANTIDLSLQWRALLHGAFVGKVIITKPVLNFVTDPKGKNEQLTINDQWQTIVKSLYPLNLNRIDIIDGELAFRSFSGSPPFALLLKDVQFHMTNMQAVTREKNSLPSSFEGHGVTPAGANANLTGKFDPFSKSPTFYLTGALKNMQLDKANNFLHHFTSIDVSKGTFSLYLELAAKNGKISGYAKPFVKDLEVLTSNSKSPIEALWKGAVEIVAKVLENSEKQTIATKVKISGTLDNPDTSVWSMIGYAIRHAFIQALIPQIDHNVKMRDVIIGKQTV